MIIDAPLEFWARVDALERKAAAGNEQAGQRLDLLTAMLEFLTELDAPPSRSDESASLKWVRQRKRYELWRVSHPFRDGVAERLICWFPEGSDTVVVALFSGDKSRIGDVWYDTVASRADPLIDQWKREVERRRDG